MPPDFDITDLFTNPNINYNPLWWMLFFLAGFIACMVHTHRTYLRWKKVREHEDEAVERAAWWFFRQDIGNDILGIAMFFGGLNSFIRGNQNYTIAFILTGACAYMMNKFWNLYDDNQIGEAVSAYLKMKESYGSHSRTGR